MYRIWHGMYKIHHRRLPSILSDSQQLDEISRRIDASVKTKKSDEEICLEIEMFFFATFIIVAPSL